MGIKSFFTFFQPQGPQTGNGQGPFKAKDIYDKPKVTFRDAKGKKIPRGVDMTSQKAVKAAQDRAKKKK
jgi:hypothetical protein